MGSAVALVLLTILAAPPHVTAQRTPSAPTIDGRLDEVVWSTTELTDSFIQRSPDERNPPTERTIVRVLYDESALYIGIICEHRRTPIRRRLTRRDRELSDADLVAVTIGSRGDRASAFRFAVNAAGVLSDGLYYDDNSYDSSWDENWDGATSATPEGWSAELRIPLRILRFSNLAAQHWGFNVERVLAARQEVDVWTYIPRTEAGYVSRLGQLSGLVGLPTSGSPIELRPFVVARVGRQAPGFGLPRGSSSNPISLSRTFRNADGSTAELGTSVGVDARLHLTPDLTLDAAVNPDFAQVEADELVLNLSTVETFYPEKRPFFLEGLDIFATPLAVLYTRPIGSVPSSAGLRSGETALEAPGPSAIPAALKLVGRVRSLSLGLISAFTSANQTQVLDVGGTEQPRLVDPPTLFNVLRLKAPVPGGHLGLIGSSTYRFERRGLFETNDSGEVLCPGRSTARLGQTCFRDAHVAGVDGRWQSPGGDYRLAAQTVASLVRGGQPQKLRDGTVLEPGDVGAGTDLWLAKQGGRRWRWAFVGSHYTRDLQLNDAGYLSRQNQVGGRLDVFYGSKEPLGPTLETDLKLGLRHWRNLDGLILTNYAVLVGWARFRNQWQLSLLVQHRQPYFDDREVGDGTSLQRAALQGVEIGMDGDPRGAIAPHLLWRLWRLTNGWYADVWGTIVMRAHPQLDLELVPNVSYTRGEPRYIEEQTNGRLLFGRLAATSVGVTLRVTYTFAPRLSLQGYGQLFLARGQYADFSAFDRAPGSRPAIHLRDLVATDGAPTTDPSFERAALNVSLVLRWEFRLGSTLYLVYTRSQNPNVTLDQGERPSIDLHALPRAPAADVLLLKLSYWWG